MTNNEVKLDQKRLNWTVLFYNLIVAALIFDYVGNSVFGLVLGCLTVFIVFYGMPLAFQLYRKPSAFLLSPLLLLPLTNSLVTLSLSSRATNLENPATS